MDLKVRLFCQILTFKVSIVIWLLMFLTALDFFILMFLHCHISALSWPKLNKLDYPLMADQKPHREKPIKKQDRERGGRSILDSPFVLKFNDALGFTVIRSPAPAFIDQELWVLSSILFVWPAGQRHELTCWEVEQDSKVGRERKKPASDWSAASQRTAGSREANTHTVL